MSRLRGSTREACERFRARARHHGAEGGLIVALRKTAVLDDEGACPSGQASLKDKHLNCLGRYAFTASQPARSLRRLRDPATLDDPDTD